MQATPKRNMNVNFMDYLNTSNQLITQLLSTDIKIEEKERKYFSLLLSHDTMLVRLLLYCLVKKKLKKKEEDVSHNALLEKYYA